MHGCHRARAYTIIELLVVILILAILTSIALPLYLDSVEVAEENTCKTNMSSIASAVQARRAQTMEPYFSGVVDETTTASNGPLRDLHHAVPRCPGLLAGLYLVSTEAGEDGFSVECSTPDHKFEWKNGAFRRKKARKKKR